MCKHIAPLLDAYRIFYHQQSDVESAAAFLYQRLSTNGSVIFIAFINEKAAGFTQLYPIFSSVWLAPAWLLNDLYVVDTARRLGIAEALLDKAKEHGLKTNAKWLLLETSFDNYKAQSLYEKNGWLKQADFFYQFNLTTLNLF